MWELGSSPGRIRATCRRAALVGWASLLLAAALMVWTATLDDVRSLTYFFAHFLGGALFLGLGAVAAAAASALLTWRVWTEVDEKTRRGQHLGLLHASVVSVAAVALVATKVLASVSV